MKLSARFCCLFALACMVISCASAGELHGDRYVGERFGTIEIDPLPGQWRVLDREGEGDNESGGPVADLKSLRPVAGLQPVVLLSAFRKSTPAITGDVLLQASREAMRRRGAECGPVLARQVEGRKVRYFEASLQQHGQPARLYYVLLDGAESFFAAQAVAPETAFAAVRQQIDELLPRIRY